MNTDPCWECMQGRHGDCGGTHVDSRVLAENGAPCTCAQSQHMTRATARLRRRSRRSSSFAAGVLYLLPPALVVLIGAHACIGAALLLGIVGLTEDRPLLVLWIAFVAGCIVAGAWHLMAGAGRDFARRLECVRVIRGAAADAAVDRQGSDS